MDLLQDISENKFTLVMMNEDQYEEKLIDVVKNAEKSSSKKICYVCLSMPYKDVINHLQKIGLDVNKFFFIDTLSSHYMQQETVDNCIFVKDPTNLVDLQVVIKKIVAEQNCDFLVFDTLSSLLMYEQNHDIIKFTHELTLEKKHLDINKVFIVIKENDLLQKEHETLIKDMGMFVDKTIEMNDTK